MDIDNKNDENFRINLNEYKWDIFFDEFQKETPRAAVILSGAFLDNLLRDLIASFMIDDVKTVNELLGSEKSFETPLSSFDARIKTAYCLGLISKSEYHDLKLIKGIRNRFAHKLHGYSFDDQEIIKLCNLLETPKFFKEVIPMVDKSHRDRYVVTVSMLASQLGLHILATQRERRIVKNS
jgi:DNA-binding MltR family transcriptional regulator